MATTAKRSISISMTGEVSYNQSFAAADNSAAPGDIDIFSLTTGDNTISVPTGGSTVKAATIIPPSGNTQVIKIKGAGGDTGVNIHKTDPTSLGLDSVSSFILNVAGNVTGLRIVWT